MSAAGHGGLSPRALSRTHAGKQISRNGAKTFKSLDEHLNHLNRVLDEDRNKGTNK